MVRHASAIARDARRCRRQSRPVMADARTCVTVTCELVHYYGGASCAGHVRKKSWNSEKTRTPRKINSEQGDAGQGVVPPGSCLDAQTQHTKPSLTPLHNSNSSLGTAYVQDRSVRSPLPLRLVYPSQREAGLRAAPDHSRRSRGHTRWRGAWWLLARPGKLDSGVGSARRVFPVTLGQRPARRARGCAHGQRQRRWWRRRLWRLWRLRRDRRRRRRRLR